MSPDEARLLTTQGYLSQPNFVSRDIVRAVIDALATIAPAAATNTSVANGEETAANSAALTANSSVSAEPAGPTEPSGRRELARRRAGTDLYAVRHLFTLCPRVKELLADTGLAALAREILGPDARLIRSLLFSKPAAANWRVPWHQDRTIAVGPKTELPGWGPWSTKSGVLHVQPPLEIMRRCVSLRLHLDPCGTADGPLRVMPGSHQSAVGTNVSEPGSEPTSPAGEVICVAEPGDVLVMRPLLLHRSLPATGGGPRRVVHLEYSAAPLPAGLRWAESA